MRAQLGVPGLVFSATTHAAVGPKGPGAPATTVEVAEVAPLPFSSSEPRDAGVGDCDREADGAAVAPVFMRELEPELDLGLGGLDPGATRSHPPTATPSAATRATTMSTPDQGGRPRAPSSGGVRRLSSDTRGHSWFGPS